MPDTKQYDLEIIINKKLKHSYISVSQERKVVVKTPHKSQSFINKLLENKAYWIEKKLTQMQQRKPLCINPIHTIEFIQSRVDYYSKLMNLTYTQLKFRKMKRRWGSCSSTGTITLNKELMKVEQNLLDYVVVHELAHLKYMNHSKKFHDLVTHYLPDAQKSRLELKSLCLVST